MTDYIRKTTLDNGLRIVTESVDRVRSVAAGIWVRTGSRDEEENKAGITHFLEHMLFKGTAERSAYDIALSLESAGGYLNAFTSNEYTCYYARCLDTRLPLALDVLSDMVANSTLPEEEMVKEKKVVLEEMKMYRDSPEDYIFELFNSHLFRNHPLGRPIIGFEDTVNNLTRSDLFDYIRDRYHPGNLLVSVSGNMNHDEVVRVTESLLGKGADAGSDRKEVPLTDYDVGCSIFQKPIEQTHMIVGRRGLWYDHPDKYLLLLANTVLGGGMSSRLHQNIREKYGYCYSIGTFNQSFTDSGLFGVYIGTDREYADHVRELIFVEFETLRSQPVPPQELKESKSQLKGKLLLSQESMNNRMTRIAKSELYFNRYISLDELVEKIDEVTDEQIMEFSKSFFDPDQYSEALLTPEDSGAGLNRLKEQV
ncbi:MAG: pitrilysin family protein [Balneolaceae bacterium]